MIAVARRAITTIMLGPITAIALLAGCSGQPNTLTPEPGPSAASAAQAHVVQHAGDKVDYPDSHGTYPAKHWVRGVVLREGFGSTAVGRPYWQAVIVGPDGRTTTIQSDPALSSTLPINDAVDLGDYVAYYSPMHQRLVIGQTIIVVTPDAVLEVLIASGSLEPTG